MCAEALGLTPDDAALRCGGGHSFDLARHGYVSLLDGRSAALRADSAEMVAARLRVHDSGVLAPAVTAVAEATAAHLDQVSRPAPLIVDIGGGPGAYLRACLRRVRGARGLVTDLSKHCARSAVRGDPSAAAVVADVWRPLPIRSGSAAAALSIFAPRNVAETARILDADGRLLVLTPQPDHLTELIAPLKMLSVAPDKADRVEAALATDFEVIDRRDLLWHTRAGATTIADLVAMGPSAFHHDRESIDEIADSVAAAHGGALEVTCAVTLTVCRVRG